MQLGRLLCFVVAATVSCESLLHGIQHELSALTTNQISAMVTRAVLSTSARGPTTVDGPVSPGILELADFTESMERRRDKAHRKVTMLSSLPSARESFDRHEQRLALSRARADRPRFQQTSTHSEARAKAKGFGDVKKRELVGVDIEGCVACQYIWSQIENDVGENSDPGDSTMPSCTTALKGRKPPFSTVRARICTTELMTSSTDTARTSPSTRCVKTRGCAKFAEIATCLTKKEKKKTTFFVELWFIICASDIVS